MVDFGRPNPRWPISWLHVVLFLLHTQDRQVDYHKKHKTFQAEEAEIPERIWPDVVVSFWLLFIGVPAFLTALYLAWIGSWFILCLIVIAVILG